MANPISKLINPWYPSTAVGFEKELATMVQLERGRGGTASLRRAATVALPEHLISPSFDEPNISNPRELTAALRDLANSAGLVEVPNPATTMPRRFGIVHRADAYLSPATRRFIEILQQQEN